MDLKSQNTPRSNRSTPFLSPAAGYSRGLVSPLTSPRPSTCLECQHEIPALPTPVSSGVASLRQDRLPEGDSCTFPEGRIPRGPGIPFLHLMLLVLRLPVTIQSELNAFSLRMIFAVHDDDVPGAEVE
jgi:hypothetical protein